MKNLINTILHPIADLHCDLLCYLGNNSKRSPYDPAARCSIPQLKEGNVKVQILAIFTETAQGSFTKGLAQANIFRDLPKSYPDVFEHIREPTQFEELRSSDKIGILPAIENASSFCEEDEDLEEALKRLTTLQRKLGKLTYLSLTWNTENRFGGGALTKVGLKNDGKRLIDYLSQHGISLDFSHTSDYLAYEILNYIDKNNLAISLLASHSNFRSVAQVPRNLPDDLVKEILNRHGIIGLNFVRPFVGQDSPHNFVKQLSHAFHLQAGSGICFGADFFCSDDISLDHRKPSEQYFFPQFEHAGSYPKVLELWKKELFPSNEMLEKICYKNLTEFLSKNYNIPHKL